MGKLTFFYMDGCPYCEDAKRALAELAAENEAYAAVEIDWIEENDPRPAGPYFYYYVPTLYVGEEKIYEASPADDYAMIRASVKQALDAACAAD
ncbi:MAG: glutaredoxin family protein [Oscillospiraceae bacterium]|nr:glutaredoxin family protein [Oscillospiraceae bacterium]